MHYLPYGYFFQFKSICFKDLQIVVLILDIVMIILLFVIPSNTSFS